jgi:putative aldouronate transport system permease protein
MPNQVILWPKEWALDAYKFILSGGGFIRAIQNTLLITLIGTPINVCFNAGLAYMLSKRNLPGRGVILKLVVFTMLFGAGMIPNYLNIMNLGLLDSYFACILPSACGAWTVVVMKSFFQAIPGDLEEAAIIDGCNDIRIFFSIVLPLSKAMLATFTLFAAVSYWNVYFSAVMYLSRSSMWPLQVFLKQIVLSMQFAEFMDMGLDVKNHVPQEVTQMACIIVAVLPILCVYPFLQKHFAKGVMVGSVKG